MTTRIGDQSRAKTPLVTPRIQPGGLRRNWDLGFLGPRLQPTHGYYINVNDYSFCSAFTLFILLKVVPSRLLNTRKIREQGMS